MCSTLGLPAHKEVTWQPREFATQHTWSLSSSAPRLCAAGCSPALSQPGDVLCMHGTKAFFTTSLSGLRAKHQAQKAGLREGCGVNPTKPYLLKTLSVASRRRLGPPAHHPRNHFHESRQLRGHRGQTGPSCPLHGLSRTPQVTAERCPGGFGLHGSVRARRAAGGWR